MYPVARNLGHCLRTGQIATDDSLSLRMLTSETLSHPYHTLPLSFFFLRSDYPLPFKLSLHLFFISFTVVRALCEFRPCFPSQLLAHLFLPCSLPLVLLQVRVTAQIFPSGASPERQAGTYLDHGHASLTWTQRST